MGDAAESPALYEWAGGRDAFERLIDAFYDRVEGDEPISPLFPGGVSREHRDHLTPWWSEVFGGPAEYTKKLGGYHRIVNQPNDLAITPEQRLRCVTPMRLADADAGLPGDPEFRSAHLPCLEWHADRDAQLPARSELPAGGSGATLGMGSGTAVRPMTR